MIRTFDGEALTEIANMGCVRPTLGGEGHLDLVPSVAHPNNYTFVAPNSVRGGVILIPLYEGTYEAHSIIAPGVNARRVLGLMREVIEYMFIHTLAETILTKVADNNRGAAWLAKELGFEEAFYRRDAFGEGVGVSFMNLPLDRWGRAWSTALEEGRSFHGALEEAKRAAGSESPVHPEDDAHDRAVGVAVAMIKAGNVEKGVGFYNRWAVFAGYAPIALLSTNPVLVDIRDALMGVNNGQVEVLQCR